MHYITKVTQDISGVDVEYQEAPTTHSAGVLSLHVHGTVPAGETAYWDSGCRMVGSVGVQPWGFLGHTHRLGHLVTGWKVNVTLLHVTGLHFTLLS